MRSTFSGPRGVRTSARRAAFRSSNGIFSAASGPAGASKAPAAAKATGRLRFLIGCLFFGGSVAWLGSRVELGTLHLAELLPLLRAEHGECPGLDFGRPTAEPVAEKLREPAALLGRQLQRLGHFGVVQRPNAAHLQPDLFEPLPLLLVEDVPDFAANFRHDGAAVLGSLGAPPPAEHLRRLATEFRVPQCVELLELLGLKGQFLLHGGLGDEGEHIAAVLPFALAALPGSAAGAAAQPLSGAATRSPAGAAALTSAACHASTSAASLTTAATYACATATPLPTAAFLLGHGILHPAALSG